MLRRVMIGAHLMLLAGIAVSTTGCKASDKATSTKAIRLPGTSLLVSLPPGWEFKPATHGGSTSTALHLKGSPGLEVTVQQNATVPHAEAVMSLPFECDYVFGSLHAALAFDLVKTPAYIPADYYSRVLIPRPPHQNEVMSTCLYLGNSVITFMINPRPSSDDASQLTALLQAVADSGRQTATLLYAPGLLNLTVLQAKARMSTGTWAAGATSLPGSNKKVDLLVRVSGSSELKMLPEVLPGTCSLEKISNHKKAPRYISDGWEPFSSETPAPNGQLVLTVCQQMSKTRMLLMMMEYGAPEVPESDIDNIARSLDEIANGIKTAQH